MSTENIAETHPFKIVVCRMDGTQVYSGDFAAGEARIDRFIDSANGFAFDVGFEYYNPIFGSDVTIMQVSGVAATVDYIVRFIPIGLDLSSSLIGVFVDPQSNIGIETVMAFVNFSNRNTEYVDVKTSSVIDRHSFGADLSDLASPQEVSVVAPVSNVWVMICPVRGANGLISADFEFGSLNHSFWTDFVGCSENG